ncbi:MAG TPA: MlaD family protein [Solirubrobacterales bacterium]|nr:MlaD family protein [Solirubrobacterales bacterium]
MRFLRAHLRDVIAIAVLIAAGLVTTWFILQEQGLRVPVLQERPFELKAEIETAQAVDPGQGQTLRVAGVRVGDVDSVELEDGVAVVTFGIEREFLPIYRNATLMLRPRTQLKDMFFEMDPGTPAGGEVSEGETLPVANSAPDVNLDEILEALDRDTQAYLRLLLVGAGKGLDGRGRELGKVLGSLGPINRQLDRLNRRVATRRTNLARLVTNLNRLTGAVGRQDDDLTRLVGASNSALGAIAEQDTNVQRAVSLLPGTLRESRRTLEDVSTFAAELGPATEELRPFAGNLEEMNASVRRLAERNTSVIRERIRPFAREARPRARDLRPAARRLARATPALEATGHRLNRLGNMVAFNPRGAEPPGTEGRDEGYLFWGAWLGHNSSSVFSVQDASGAYRRGYLTLSCRNLRILVGLNPIAPVFTGLGQLVGPGGPC